MGNRLSQTEQRAHFALWALVKSPLIIGADLRRGPPGALCGRAAHEACLLERRGLTRARGARAGRSAGRRWCCSSRARWSPSTRTRSAWRATWSGSRAPRRRARRAPLRAGAPGARRVHAEQAGAQVWAAPLAGGGRAVALFNKHVASDDNFPATEMTVYWGQVGLPSDAEVRPARRPVAHSPMAVG